MARNKRSEFKNGVWIKNWKFRSDKKPFSSTMTPTALVIKKNKIVRFALERLKDKKAWTAINEEFKPLRVIPSWSATGTARTPVYHLKIELVDPDGPPGNTVVAPPPPTQPPPPSL